MDYFWTIMSFGWLKIQPAQKWLVIPHIKTSPALAKPKPKALLILAVSGTGSGPDAPNSVGRMRHAGNPTGPNKVGRKRNPWYHNTGRYVN